MQEVYAKIEQNPELLLEGAVVGVPRDLVEVTVVDSIVMEAFEVAVAALATVTAPAR